MTQSSDRMTTLREVPAVADVSSSYCLLLIVDGAVTTHELPDHGELRIGRAKDNHLQIPDPSVSRHHALLRMGPRPTLEDLGSANGCRLRGEWLVAGQAVALPAGEVVDVGSAMIMLQQRSVPTRALRVWSHGYFEGRLEDECARATRTGTTFALVRLRCDSELSSELVQQALGSRLRPDDVVGTYGPGDYEILLVERDAEEARAVVEGLLQRLEAVEVKARAGTACFPQDGRAAHALAESAGLEARGEASPSTSGGHPVIIRAQAMRELYALVERVATANITVLITGDTGVGKEVLAEAVHRGSPRRQRPFLRLNCAALPEALLESELFGHERGAFTGAQSAKTGLLETAQGGTIFLDEVGELPLAVQVKLLRVLEDRKVWRVGGVKPRPIDVRFVAATNRDLEAEVQAGRFRQDLFFRLNGVALRIPSLRERAEEIEPLATSFVRAISQEQGRAVVPDIHPEAMKLLLEYSWPGNIRELRNVMERAVLLSGDGAVLVEHLPVEKMQATVTTRLSNSEIPPPRESVDQAPTAMDEIARGQTVPPPLWEATTGKLSAAEQMRKQVEAVERQHIVEALNRCGGNQTRAAKELGMSRRTLISRLEAYGIPRPLKDRGSE